MLLMKSALFYNKDYNIIRQRLLEESELLQNHLDDYNKLVDFLVVAEDHRFYSHPGYDIIGICRALYKDVFCGKKEGASTIEQQLVRVLTEDYRYSIRRKLKEIYLATKLKYLADKYTLAAIYLHVSRYGTNYKNLDQILRKFETKLSKDMDDNVCAEIIARLKYPEPQSHNPERMVFIEKRKVHIIHLYKSHNTK